MKRRLLSILLAVAMIMGTAIPASRSLPTAFDVNAAGEVLTTGDSIIYVNTFAELKYALKYAEENSTIVLNDDIVADSADMEVEVGTHGMLTLDLNGMYFTVKNSGASFIRLTDSTRFYLIDSSDGNGYLDVKINNAENASIISLENKNAELHIYGASMGLSGVAGSTDNTDSAAIKISQFRSFTAYGLSLSATAKDSSAISFEPVTENEFASSDVYLADTKLTGYDYCITFTRNYETDDFFMKDSFASFCVEMNEFKGAAGGSGYIFDTNGVCDVTIADILPDDSLVIRSSDNSPVSGTTKLYDIDYDIKSVIDRNEDGSFTAEDACKFAGANHIKGGNYREILYSPFAHFRQCTACSEIFAFSHITNKTDYVAPGENTEGRTAGEYCIDAKHGYDSSVPIPAKNHVADTTDMVYISTAEEFIKAMYSTDAGITLCLVNNLFINLDLYDGLVLSPQARGDLTIDLNGRNIYCENSQSYYLFRLGSADSENGAIRLHIVNSEPEADSSIVFRSKDNAFAMFLLEHPAAGLYIYPDVKIVNELSGIDDYMAASNTDVDTVRLEKFNELEIYGAEIVNKTPKGSCIEFLTMISTDYSKASVTINSAVLRAMGSCINFNATKTGSFAQFDVSDTYFAATVEGTTPRLAATADITVGDIVAENHNLNYAFNFEQNVKFSKAISTLSNDKDIIISRGLKARCEEHQTREILLDGRYHYLKCDLCDKVVERVEHERIVPDEEGDCSMNIYREYLCDCGINSAVTFTGHDLKRVAATKTDCQNPGYLEYYECRDCGALFDSPYGGTKRDISYFWSPVTEHNFVILLEMHEPDCDDCARRVWGCSAENCEATETTYDNNEYPTEHLTSVSVHDGLAATCTTKGYSGTYYTCARNDACGAMYKDSALTEEITEAELDISALGHDFSDFEYVFDATCVDSTVTKATCKTCGYEKFEVTEAEGHDFRDSTFIYQSCEDICVKEYSCDFCDAKRYERSYPSGHKYDDITENVTCTDGVRTITCSNPWCGDFYTETVEALGHKTEKVPFADSDCDTDGNKEYYRCTREGCTEIFWDAAATQKINNSALVVIPAKGCSLKLVAGKENTCTEDGWFVHKVCTVCGKTYMTDGVTELDPYKFMEARGHSLSYRTAKPATCTQSGTKAYYECSGQFGCGAKFLDAAATVPVTDITDPVKSHTLYYVKATAPTCTQKGIAAHYRCEGGCGLYFSDNKGTVIASDALWLGAQHTPGNWEVTKAPSPDSPGVEALKCAICKAVISTKNIPYTEPEYILGDADMNGKLESADARKALRAAVGLEVITAGTVQFKAADADKSGKLESADARKILRAVVGLEGLK